MKNVWIRQTRRKAVWGPKRTLGALVVFCVTGLVVSPAAAKSNSGKSVKVPAAPGSLVKNYKLDDALTDRANRANPAATTRVIVTLVPGAKLPSEFKRFALNQRLDVINGEVLEL